MADPQSAARIRELEQRMAAMPGSRIFVGLAEEYRRAGRFADALATLRNGLEAHPTYLSARIAIARLYQETGRVPEAIDAFSRVLAADRENLVAAKALGDLYARQGNPLEAVKKLKLYRALSGDRAVDERIAVLERETKPEAGSGPLPAASAAPAAPPPPAPARPSTTRLFDPLTDPDSGISGAFSFGPDPNATLALSTLDFSAGSEAELPLAETSRPAAVPGAPTPAAHEPSPAAPRDESAASSEAGASSVPIGLPEAPAALSASGTVDAALPAAPEAFSPTAEAVPSPTVEAFLSEDERETTAPEESDVPAGPAPEIPAARTLAELYASQGHVEEAQDIYDRLAARETSDASAVAHPAAPVSASDDPVAHKRHALETWLARIKANAAVARQ